MRASHQVAVLALARDVALGNRIVPADLSVVDISVSRGLSPVPADAAKRVVGETARVALVAGTLLVPNDLGSRNGRTAGGVVVGIALKPGQLPANGVAPGDVVDVIATATPGLATVGGVDVGSTASGIATGGTGVIAQHVDVAGVSLPSATSSDTTVVSVVVPPSLVLQVANASAAGQAAIALVRGGS